MDDNNEEETSKKTSSKNESNKTKEISSTSSSVLLGKQKLTKAEKRFKKYKRAIKLIKNMNTKINCIFLNELTKFNNYQIQSEYDREQILIAQKKFFNMVKFHNKIREIVNCTDLNEINKFIYQNDFITYNIQMEEQNQNKTTPEGNIIIVENNNNNKNDTKNIKGNKKKLNKISPIKNFWKLSLINCQFFKINKIDSQIFNFLRDIILIPLEYPNFKIEFHFKENEYLKENILTKEYYYTNAKKERLYSSRGTDIEWEEDKLNPTLKEFKKVIKDIKLHKRKSRIKVKEETIYVNNDSFFKIFDIDKCTIEKDFVEANFFINDFFPNILEYYLNIIEIKYDDLEDELISNN